MITSRKPSVSPYRIYSDDEISEFLREDRLPRQFIKTAKKHLKIISSKRIDYLPT